jgi:type IV secretory pathway VirB10-like protein
MILVGAHLAAHNGARRGGKGGHTVVRLHRRWRRARTHDDQLFVAMVIAAVVFAGAAAFALLHPAKTSHDTPTRVTAGRGDTRAGATTTTTPVLVLGATVTTAPPPPPSTAARHATTTTAPPPPPPPAVVQPPVTTAPPSSSTTTTTSSTTTTTEPSTTTTSGHHLGG